MMRVTGFKKEDTMSAKESYRRAVAGFNKDDTRGFAALYAASAIVYDPLYPQPLKGRDAIEQDVVDVRRAFPDARFTLRAVIEAGETAAVEYNLGGTHSGPLATPDGEIPATGKQLSIGGAVFSRLNAQGEVVEERRYYDVAGMLAQLGLP
jgi:steroid delta-isomerase-like uncharacterized protein